MDFRWTFNYIHEQKAKKLTAEDLASCQAGQRSSELIVQLGFFDVWCFYRLMLQVIPKPGFIAEYFPMDPLIQIYQPRKLFDVSLQQSNPLAAIESIYSIIIIIIIIIIVIIRLVYTVLCVKDYEDGIIPEGLDPDIVRTEKQLDFEEAWACACERGVSDAKIYWLLFHQSEKNEGFLWISLILWQFPGRPSKPGKGCPCAMVELLQHDSPRAPSSSRSYDL